MSGLLRVSKLVVGRQQTTSRITASTAHRQLSWAPPAYRSVARQQKVRAKRKTMKKIGRGRDGLWKHLQEVYGDSNEKESTFRQHDKKKKLDTANDRMKKQFRREEQLDTAQQEFRAALHRYRNALFPASASKKSRKGSGARLLKSLHQLCADAVDKEQVTISMETLLATESQFRDLGKLTRQVTSFTCRMSLDEKDDDDGDDKQEKSSVVAEELLRGLLTLKQDRALLVERAKEAIQQDQQAETDQSGGLMGWLTNVFVVAPGEDATKEDDESEVKEPTLMVHEEATFGPTKSQYGHVIKCIRNEVAALQWEPHGDSLDDIQAFRNESKDDRKELLDSAKRMTALLELHLEQGGTTATSMTAPTKEIYSRVGSLQAANEARRIYTGICFKKVPRDVFHWVLRAYRLAALMEETIEARAEAAKAARALLEDREHYSLAATSFHGTANGTDPRGESYAIVLETLENAGQKAVPDRITQAEALLKLYLGDTLFNNVIHRPKVLHQPSKKKPQPAKVDMSVFESLLQMYVAKGHDYKFLQMAKNILKCAERQQAAVAVKLDDALATAEEKRIFPSTKSYNSVLSGVYLNVKHNQSRLRHMKNEGDRQGVRQSMQSEATYATSLLDSMPVTCPPDLATFELLLKIWATTGLPESGDRAQEILSRMTIRQACLAPSKAWSDSSRVYSHLLQCWATGPGASSAGTLQQALRIVEKMEAQSGIQHMPPLDASEEEKSIFDSVYEMNESESYRAAYNGALRICSLCVDDSEVAFQAAFDIYNRMIAAGVPPDQDTFAYLFASCLLPGEDAAANEHRQELASTVIAFASDHGLDTRQMTKQVRAFKMRGGKKQKRKAS